MLYFPKDAISSLNPLPLLFNLNFVFQPIAKFILVKHLKKDEAYKLPTTIYLLAD